MKTGATKLKRQITSGSRKGVSRKLVMVGDEATGKTSMLYVFSKDIFPEAHIPTVVETQMVQVTPSVRPGSDLKPYPPVKFTIWDTAGQESYNKLRPLSYDKTDIFMVCYSVDNFASYKNVEDKWVPEVRQFCPSSPILLVATKTDQRYDLHTRNEMARKGQEPITTKQGQDLGQKVQAQAYLESCCEDKDSVFSVFQAAATVAFYVPTMDKKTKSCTLL